MAFKGAGGREYYVDVKQLESGSTNCIGKGRIKGIYSAGAVSHTFIFPSGTSIKMTPDADQIIPFCPAGVTFASGNAYALY
jgi:hypothetical protein